ncbi:MAG: hypothetical protein IJO24_04650 [Clostridia bacterium]|nr:hypothetical protein [Clostridia bacterium]
MHIEELLDEIIETIDNGFNLKIFHKTIVDGDKVIDLSNTVRSSLPAEFESAKRITADRNKIIESAEQWAISKKNSADKEAVSIVEGATAKANSIVAQAEAQAQQIIENAQLHAEQLISENNITRVANERATNLLETTKNDCDMLMNSTRADCDELTSQAKQWADDVRTAAYDYAMRMVAEVDNFLQGSVSDLRQTKGNLENMQ